MTLTNGSAYLLGALLVRAGLDGLVDRSLSVAEIGRWKPVPEPDLWAAAELRLAPLGLRGRSHRRADIRLGQPCRRGLAHPCSRHPTSPEATCPRSSADC